MGYSFQAINKLEEVMAQRQANEALKKGKMSRSDARRREKKIVELEKDLRMERQKYEERVMQIVKENEQLKVGYLPTVIEETLV